MTYEILTNHNEWKYITSERHKQYPERYINFLPDFNFSERIKDLISGYMVGPVALVDNKQITAKTLRVKSFSDAVEYFSNKNNKYYLYEISWYSPVPQWIDPLTFAPLDEPTLIEGLWWIRYAEIKNTNQ